MGGGFGFFGEGGEGVGGDAVFALFAGDVDFEEYFGADVEFLAFAVEDGDEFFGFDAMDEGESGGEGVGGFVALEVADQVPGGVGGGEGVFLGYAVGYAVFAEVSEAEAVEFVDFGGGDGFGDGYEGDGLGGAVGAGAGGGDAGVDLLEVAFYGHGMAFVCDWWVVESGKR